jgi:hypothetical protein
MVHRVLPVLVIIRNISAQTKHNEDELFTLQTLLHLAWLQKVS